MLVASFAASLADDLKNERGRVWIRCWTGHGCCPDGRAVGIVLYSGELSKYELRLKDPHAAQ